MLRIAFKSVIFHLLCIIIFYSVYSLLPINSFLPEINDTDANKKKYSPALLDLMYLTVTIQAGVGMPSITPVTTLSKVVIILQQLFRIFATIIILYMFIFEIS